MYCIYKNNTITELGGNIEFSASVYQTAESLTDDQRIEFDVYELVAVAPSIERGNVLDGGFDHSVIGRVVTRTPTQRQMTEVELQQEFDDAKASLKTEATDARWQRETGGITLPGGIQIATGTEDQNRITTVIANAQLAGVTSVDFKSASGWVTLTLAEVQGIAAAIALHLQACFSAERAHHEAIEALTSIEALQAYDVTAG